MKGAVPSSEQRLCLQFLTSQHVDLALRLHIFGRKHHLVEHVTTACDSFLQFNLDVHGFASCLLGSSVILLRFIVDISAKSALPNLNKGHVCFSL